MEVDAVVPRRRVLEALFHLRTKKRDIFGRDDNSKSIEASPMTLDSSGSNYSAESLGSRSGIVTRLDDVDQQPPTHVDSSQPLLVLVGEIGSRISNALENVVRAAAPEGRADEAAQASCLHGRHRSIVSPPPAHPSAELPQIAQMDADF